MTDEQRARLIELRSQGYGYANIANAIGATKDSVRSFCRSHGLTGTKAESNSRIAIHTEICPQCGHAVSQKPGVKRIRFCSAKCRQDWWNSHPEAVSRKAVYSFTCSCCGTDFTAYGNAHRKYCSHACYIRDRFGRSATV